MSKPVKVAVLLAGCGHLDGAEVREAVLTLLALDQMGAAFQCIAPNAPQHHVVNHVTGEPMAGAQRNILEESSRIARVGQCLDLAQARVQDLTHSSCPAVMAWPKIIARLLFRVRMPTCARMWRPLCAVFLKPKSQSVQSVLRLPWLPWSCTS